MYDPPRLHQFPQDSDATQEFVRKRRNSPRCDAALSHDAFSQIASIPGIKPLLLEEVLVHTLDVQGLFDPAANLVPDHQLGQLDTVDQHDAGAEPVGRLSG